VGYCLDILDLFLSKAAAGRPKDREFCSALLKYGYLSPEDVIDKIPIMPIGEEDQKRLLSRIRRWAKP